MVEPDVQREVAYIIRRAKRGDARVVTLGQLIFFSTQLGDAWMLDVEDHLALRLADAGEPLPVHVTETPTRFEVGWTASYQLDGDTFVVADASGSRAISGYPVDELKRQEQIASVTRLMSS